MYAWRSGGDYTEHAVSNTSALLLFDLSGNRVRIHAASEPILWTIPTGLQPWGAGEVAAALVADSFNATLANASFLNAASPNATGLNSTCFGYPTRTCNLQGVCLSGRCVCNAGFVDLGCRVRRSCQTWQAASATYSSSGCVYLGQQEANGAARCACNSSAEIAVLQQDLTGHVPLHGCADSRAVNFDFAVEVPILPSPQRNLLHGGSHC